MSIEWVVTGLPRSGTTWASVWLTDGDRLTHHDPLYSTHYADWDRQLSRDGYKVGVSCTGIWRWTDWLAKHPARKVILHRDLDEIAASMAAIGLPPQDLELGESLLDQIDGLHVPFTALFDPDRAKTIWDWCMVDKPFCKERHKLLVDVEMQPKFSGLSVGQAVTRKLIAELMAAQYD